MVLGPKVAIHGLGSTGFRVEYIGIYRGSTLDILKVGA